MEGIMFYHGLIWSAEYDERGVHLIRSGGLPAEEVEFMVNRLNAEELNRMNDDPTIGFIAPVRIRGD
jgi:hypothetical protein